MVDTCLLTHALIAPVTSSTFRACLLNVDKVFRNLCNLCSLCRQTTIGNVATDMLNMDVDEYLVTVDYDGGYFELDIITAITSAAIILWQLKAQFAGNGSVDTLVS